MDEQRVDIPAAVSKTRQVQYFHAGIKKYWRLTLFGRTCQMLRDTASGVPKLLFELLKSYGRGRKSTCSCRACRAPRKRS